jgi:succinate dehydrogenase / fumarate reductase iron-sulfur subunit
VVINVGKLVVKVLEGKEKREKQYEVMREELDPYTTVLELLLKIREEQDPSLVLRYSCRMALCGSCGMIINGRPRLACLTKMKDLDEPIRIEPLKNVGTIRGLVPDLSSFFSKYRKVRPFLVAKDEEEQESPKSPYRQTDEEVKRYLQFNYCIQCGLCYSACPVVSSNPNFLGPAAINVAYRYTADSRDSDKLRVLLLDTPNGVWSCRVAGSCSVVCPKGVDPSLSIQLAKSLILRRKI